ncbi:glycosyltransferase family 4 protein [Verrucomicrobiota bacterium]
MVSEKKITVLQLCEHFGGKAASLHGVARGFQWWLPEFDENRFRVILCSRKARDKAAEQMEAVGLEPCYLGYGKFDPRNFFKLVRLIKDEKVDIIHAHGYGACTWGRLAGIFLKKPVIVHERCNTLTVPFFQRSVEWFLGKFTRYGFAVSESSRQFCINKRYMRPETVRVLYNGILKKDVPEADGSFINALKSSYGRNDQDKIIGIVGRLESHKGHIDAFKALKKVLEKIPDVCVWVVGDGTYADTLSEWIKTNNLSEKVDFLGFRSDARKVIRCFDVQLFPSHMEGTPNTLFEAMAVGNAIVASTADGQGEILEDEKTALMFVPGDIDKMTDQLLRVLNNEDLRLKLKEASVNLSKKFDGRKTIETMQGFYVEILKG